MYRSENIYSNEGIILLYRMWSCMFTLYSSMFVKQPPLLNQLTWNKNFQNKQMIKQVNHICWGVTILQASICWFFYGWIRTNKHGCNVTRPK